MLTGNKAGRPLSAKKLKEANRSLASLSVEGRVRVLALRPDRADVIVPALQIFRRVMEWADIRKIHVPFIGLSDGLIREPYERHIREGARPLPAPGRGSLSGDPPAGSPSPAGGSWPLRILRPKPLHSEGAPGPSLPRRPVCAARAWW